jgi:hypothetical protein
MNEGTVTDIIYKQTQPEKARFIRLDHDPVWHDVDSYYFPVVKIGDRVVLRWALVVQDRRIVFSMKKEQ